MYNKFYNKQKEWHSPMFVEFLDKYIVILIMDTLIRTQTWETQTWDTSNQSAGVYNVNRSVNQSEGVVISVGHICLHYRSLLLRPLMLFCLKSCPTVRRIADRSYPFKENKKNDSTIGDRSVVYDSTIAFLRRERTCPASVKSCPRPRIIHFRRWRWQWT